MLCARKLVFALCPVIISACATSSELPELPSEAAIVYETRSPPFCGPCHTTKIVVTPNDEVWLEQGHWAGRYRDWRITRRPIEISPPDVTRFRETLDTFRPDANLLLSDGSPECETYYTDDAEIRIQWRDERGAVTLIYDFGCDVELLAEMRRALRTAPHIIGVRLLEFGDTE